jgi:hypothetical protein
MSLMGKDYTCVEVTMTSPNQSTARFADMRGSLHLILLAFILLAVFCSTMECRAQAVPPRVQTLQMVNPPAPPPEPPIQKEIREVKQEVQKKTQSLDQKMEAFLGVKPPPRLDVGVPPPPPRPQFSRDEEIRLLEVRLQKLQEELVRVSRRLEDLKQQPSKKRKPASKLVK